MGNYKLSKRSLSRLDGIRSVLIAVLVEGIKDSPYDFGIPKTGGFRTANDQKELYNLGVSKCDGVKNKSYHQSGNAFDIYIYEAGKANWNKDKLKLVAEHLKETAKNKYGISLEWGGDWISWQDYPHFQIT